MSPPLPPLSTGQSRRPSYSRLPRVSGREQALLASRQVRAGRARVLVVDDDVHARQLLRTALEDEHYQTFEAGSGEECLEAAPTLHPDLIILDVQLPGIDGFETCQRIREHPALSDVKLIMLTGYAGGANVARGHLLGADAFLAKPLDIGRLLDEVRALLGRP